jgi:hypothetical protein
LVLRLRGGGWSIIIKIPGVPILTIEGPSPKYQIFMIYAFIYSRLPNLQGANFKLINKGVVLERNKTIEDYKINPANNEIDVDVPEYMLSSKGVLKHMKISGYWQYNEQMIGDLALQEEFNKWISIYGTDKKDKVMTKTIKEFLELTYSR